MIEEPEIDVEFVHDPDDAALAEAIAVLLEDAERAEPGAAA